MTRAWKPGERIAIIGDIVETDGDTAYIKWRDMDGNQTVPVRALRVGPKKDTPPDGEADPEVIVFCERMQGHVEKQSGRKPYLAPTWKSQTRLLLQHDKIPLQEALNVLEYVAADNFWATNILSPESFRRHYTRLALAMRRSKVAPPTIANMRGAAVDSRAAVLRRRET